MQTRILEEYRTSELFRLDLQTNLRTYIDSDLWQKIKPAHPLPWDYSDMLHSFQKYTRLAGSKTLSS